MSFRLSAEQDAILETVRGLAMERCDAGLRRAAVDDGVAFDAGFWSELAALGATACLIPEAQGGLGLRMIDAALICEALGYAAAPGPFLGHALASLAIGLSDDEALKSRWLPRLASGEVIGTVALGEANERWLPGEWESMLEGGRLRGAKSAVTGLPGARLIVVGIADGLALIDLQDAAPVEVTPLDSVDRTRPIADVRFDDCPAQRLATGLPSAHAVLEAGLVLLAADAFGGATRSIEMATAYVKERRQFGQPVGAFQAVKHQLATLLAEVEPARGLYWYAAHAFDEIPGERSRMAALAKAHLADRFLETAREAIELHGGIGYTWEHDAHIWLKRAMFDFAWLGVPALHRSRSATLAGW